MKIKSIIAIAAGVVLAACTSQTGFSIKATEAGGGVINVIDLLSGDVITSGEGDEVLLVGKADKNALLAVQKEGEDWQTLLFNDGEPVCVNIEDHSVEGSELNRKVTEFDLASSKAISIINDAIDSLEDLDPAGQVVNSASIQSKIEEFMKSYKDLLSQNHDNIAPAAFMPSIFSYLDEEEINEELKPEYAYTKHPYTQKFIKMMDEQKAKEEAAEAAAQQIIGSKFTDLEEPDVDGKNHKLSEYVGTGKWVLVDFWASWCGPCRREMPNVVAAYKKYSAKGFDIVGLSFDNDKEAWVKAIADLDMPWHHLSDLQGWQSKAAEVYGIRSIPSSLLINPEGIIVARDLRGDALGNKLAEIFGE